MAKANPSAAALADRVAARWPGVAFAPETIARAVESRHPEDLCLARSAAGGDSEAFEVIEREFVRQAVSRAARIAPSQMFRDEVAQALRERLFLSVPERPARIGDYDGSTPFASWVSVVARHCAIDLLRAKPPDESDLDEHIKRLAHGRTPESDIAKERFRAEFRRALTAATQSLGERELSVLRQHFADGVRLEEMAAAHGVHRATVARWLATARATILARTRQNLARLLNADEGEIDSLLRAAHSSLDASLGVIFRTPVAG